MSAVPEETETYQSTICQPKKPADSFVSEKYDGENLLKQFHSAGINIPRDMVEKILRPSSGPEDRRFELRKILANPTPVALMGFLVCLSPLSCDLMGWRGAGGMGAAGMGSYYFFGGLLMILGGLLEFIIGKTVAFVIFSSFGAFWLTFAATLQPFYQVGAMYAPPNATSPMQGFATVGFTASFGFFQVFMAVLCFIYMVCSTRSNICMVMIFCCLTISFGLLTAVNWEISQALAGQKSKIALAHNHQLMAGRFLFAASMIGWYVFLALMLLSCDFPIQIPVGDLSKIVKGRSERLKNKGSNSV